MGNTNNSVTVTVPLTSDERRLIIELVEANAVDTTDVFSEDLYVKEQLLKKLRPGTVEAK